MTREDVVAGDESDTEKDHTRTVERVFDVVAETATEIRAGLPGRRSAIDEENPSGETQLAADAHADQLLRERLGSIDGVASYVSEEREAKVDASDGNVSAADPDGVAVAVDPLDGSSNLRSNNAMGTIVGVYDAPLPASGRELVGAGYLLYGPITTMVVAHDGVVREEVVAPGSGDSGVDRRTVTPELVLPDEPVVYGFGGRVPDWTPEFAAYAEEIERELKLRYGGAMVGDVNQVLTYGGIFSYPALQERPEGKLRLQFEANPMAYVVETAGGRSSDGAGSILDAESTELHERTPVHLGNAELIERLEGILQG